MLHYVVLCTAFRWEGGRRSRIINRFFCFDKAHAHDVAHNLTSLASDPNGETEYRVEVYVRFTAGDQRLTVNVNALNTLLEDMERVVADHEKLSARKPHTVYGS